MLPIHFAPLQGFTEAAFRNAHRRHAGKSIASYYTPFIRTEKGAPREKDLRDLERERGACQQMNLPHNTIPQIIAKDLGEFKLLTSALLNQGYQHIDINMGCPYPMQTKSGRGAGILPKINVIKEILAEIQRQSASVDALRFSIKMRLGLADKSECLALLPLLNDTPLSHIALHPRLASQQYKGALDFETFGQFYQHVRHPLIFNGDLTTVKEIEKIQQMFPNLAGAMIGRGLLSNPALAAEYASLPHESPLQLLFKIHQDMLLDFRTRHQGDAQILDKIRPFWTYAELPKKLQKKIAKARTLSDYLQELESVSLSTSTSRW